MTHQSTETAPAAVDPGEPRMRRVPQQERSRRRVEAILDAAARIVVADGVDAVGTRSIADLAGVTVASLYQYFADKDDILLALVERDMAEMDEAVGREVGSLETISLQSLVEATIRAFTQVYAVRPAFVMIYLRGRTNQAIRDYGREHNRKVAAMLFGFAADLGLTVPEVTVLIAELAVEMGDRLFQLAYEETLTGDPAIISEAVVVITTYLQRYATPAGLTGIQV
jgi:AcrR family transcriptional regulator